MRHELKALRFFTFLFPFFSLSIPISFLGGCGISDPAPNAATTFHQSWEKDVLPILQLRCGTQGGCHSSFGQENATFLDTAPALRGSSALQLIETKLMPPPGSLESEAFTLEERLRVLNFITNTQ